MRLPIKEAPAMNEQLIQGALSRVGLAGMEYQKLQSIVTSYRKLSRLCDANSKATSVRCETILRKVRLTGKLPGLIT
jgi:hypothetical protein